MCFVIFLHSTGVIPVKIQAYMRRRKTIWPICSWGGHGFRCWRWLVAEISDFVNAFHHLSELINILTSCHLIDLRRFCLSFPAEMFYLPRAFCMLLYFKQSIKSKQKYLFSSFFQFIFQHHFQSRVGILCEGMVIVRFVQLLVGLVGKLQFSNSKKGVKVYKI